MNSTKLIEKLADFAPDGRKVVSIYLDASSDTHGRDDYAAWLKTQFYEHSVQFERDAAAAADYAALEARVNEYLSEETDNAVNGVAIFAAVGAGDELFEAVQLDEAFPRNRFFVFDRPHVFPLVRLIEQNPRYVALWADSNKAHVYVFGGDEDLDAGGNSEGHKVEEIQNVKTKRTKVGGWSQARYQRHVDNFRLQHAKETVEEVEKLMRDERINLLVLAGDETGVLPVLRAQLSKESEDKVVAVVNLSQYASEDEIREKSREALAALNVERDRERVERALGAAKAAAGFGAIGVESTLAALSNGQVEELVIASDFDAIEYDPREVARVLGEYAPGDDNGVGELPEVREKRQVADELLIRAMNSGSRIVFIEDGTLLEEAGGVAAVLRYATNASGA